MRLPPRSRSSGGNLQVPMAHERSRDNLGGDISISISLDTHNNTGGPGSGAAGIGARGRSLRSGMQDPFGALSNPPEQYEMTESRRSWNQGSLRGGGGTEVTTYDMLQAAGLSGSDPYAVTRAPSTRLANNRLYHWITRTRPVFLQLVLRTNTRTWLSSMSLVRSRMGVKNPPVRATLMTKIG
jgi:hypothetical protein